MSNSNGSPTPPSVMIEWGVAMQAAPGEARMGDRHVARLFPHGALMAVIDGLGHGQGAADAADIAAATLEEHPSDAVDVLFKRCHERLKRSRGVVMSLASFDLAHNTMTWLGVGNVRGIFTCTTLNAPTREWLFLRGGIIGYNMPSLRPIVMPIGPGDMLIFATDGIRSTFAEPSSQANPPKMQGGPQFIADTILAQHGRKTDDALVLVVQLVARG